MNWLRAAILGLAALWGAAGSAQEGSSSVILVDPDFVYANSSYARALRGTLEQDQLALGAENRRLFDALRAEELRLTELRDTLPPEDFAELVETFEAQVTEIRRVQDEKTRDLDVREATLRQVFFRRAAPILTEIRIERGASLLVTQTESVVDFDPDIDISRIAVDRIDAAYSGQSE